MNIIQDVLIYITCFFMLLATWRGFRGASRIRIFEQKQWRMLRLISFLTYINLGWALAAVMQDVFRDRDPGQFLKTEILALFFVVVWISLGMGKIRGTLIHGKKYAAVFLYFGIALVVMLLLLGYQKLGEYAGFTF